MERSYTTGQKSDVIFFTGTEVEKTPAFGLKTMFVVGLHSIDIIKHQLDQCDGIQHIYLGANQSFNLPDDETSMKWDIMIRDVLKLSYLVTLDFDIRHAEWVCEGGYCESNNFIPQLSVKIPYISLLGYNATLKIDDIGFDKTNPGVWCHSLHDLQVRSVFTPWSRYQEDEPI